MSGDSPGGTMPETSNLPLLQEAFPGFDWRDKNVRKSRRFCGYLLGKKDTAKIAAFVVHVGGDLRQVLTRSIAGSDEYRFAADTDADALCQIRDHVNDALQRAKGPTRTKADSWRAAAGAIGAALIMNGPYDTDTEPGESPLET